MNERGGANQEIEIRDEFATVVDHSFCVQQDQDRSGGRDPASRAA
jgi:hypothetical protein